MTFAEVIVKGELVFPFLLNFNLVVHMNWDSFLFSNICFALIQ